MKHVAEAEEGRAEGCCYQKEAGAPANVSRWGGRTSREVIGLLHCSSDLLY
jgi:hypothetical protein